MASLLNKLDPEMMRGLMRAAEASFRSGAAGRYDFRGKVGRRGMDPQRRKTLEFLGSSILPVLVEYLKSQETESAAISVEEVEAVPLTVVAPGDVVEIAIARESRRVLRGVWFTLQWDAGGACVESSAEDDWTSDGDTGDPIEEEDQDGVVSLISDGAPPRTVRRKPSSGPETICDAIVTIVDDAGHPLASPAWICVHEPAVDDLSVEFEGTIRLRVQNLSFAPLQFLGAAVLGIPEAKVEVADDDDGDDDA